MSIESCSTSVNPVMRLLAHTKCEPDIEAASDTHRHENYFRSVEWSPDGTCLITNSADNSIRTFIVPPELLDQRDLPLRLDPYSSIKSTEPADALVCFPGYNLEDSQTTFVLSAINEHPIRLNSTLTGNLVASYPLVNANTEAFIKPQSMIFTTDGSHFIAGSQNRISTFDVSRPGSEPASSIQTGPKRSKALGSNPSTSLRGLLSALAIDGQYNVLAAGTLSRQIGLYDSAGQGECISVFSVIGTDADESISGNGITDLAWSKCGRYLYIIERKSDGAMIYDIRKSGQLLSWIKGRAGMTNQRTKVELCSNADTGGTDIWAGGQDGKLRYWTDVHLHEGAVNPSRAFHVHEGKLSNPFYFVSADLNRCCE